MNILRTILVLSATFWAVLPGSSLAAESYVVRGFRKIVLTTDFYAEGSGIGDFNRDGNMDAVYGPEWYEGPEFQRKHVLYPVARIEPTGYAPNFITMVHDINADGYDDILVNEWPGKAVHWFENPRGKEKLWEKHLAHPKVDNESPQFGDITGDGRPELLFHSNGLLGYAEASADTNRPWRFVPVSEKESWGQYTHGLGFGDVNGDDRPDFLMAGGWWEQPAATEPNSEGQNVTWKKHEFRFGSRGGAQMYPYDVDGDGDRDVITSLDAHGYGLVWFEQVEKDGQITFNQHDITGSLPEHNAYGVKFSQMHSICLADMDGDGLKDIVTGKRYWAHGPKGDEEPGAPAVLYWFRLVRSENGDVDYIPYQIDNDSGVGTQFSVGDLNGDKHPDVVIGNKKGGYVFLQEVRQVGQAEWEAAQPKKLR